MPDNDTSDPVLNYQPARSRKREAIERLPNPAAAIAGTFVFVLMGIAALNSLISDWGALALDAELTLFALAILSVLGLAACGWQFIQRFKLRQ